MKRLLLIALLLAGVSAMGQNKTYEVSEDPKNGQVVFRGPVTFSDLENEATFTWLPQGSAAYKPNRAKISYLKEHLLPGTYSLVLFLGTWCADSHDMVPQLEKVLNEIGYPLDRLTIYGVEREKSTRSDDVRKYHITNLPTVILLKDGKEVGRITETVHKSVEADLARIIKG